MHTSYKKISLKAQITLLEVWIVFFIKTLFKTQEQTHTQKKKSRDILSGQKLLWYSQSRGAKVVLKTI